MSTDRIHGYVIFICDECDEQLDTQEKDFHDALAEMHQHKWRVVRDEDGRYVHMCRDCVNNLPSTR